MFDARLRPLIDGPLNAAGTALHRRGVSADSVTVVGFVLGMACAGLIALGLAHWALVPLVLGRVCDGLDGAIARQTGPTDRGGFLDITLDFVFYGAVPVAFAIADPQANAIMAAVLLFSFLANGTSFLAFAALAQKRGIETDAQGQKSIYYLAGLAEGGETIAFFFAFCLLPHLFPWLAGAFAALCVVSATARIIGGARMLDG